MPRDRRLYMTFPNDFWTHPKVSRLSDAAFRAFVEANGHSRMRETDGLIEKEDAEFMWKDEALEELLRSHPTRPLVVREGENYLIRDYAEHQLTKADREQLTQKRVDAGRASAEKRRARAQHMLNTSEQTATEREIEKEREVKKVPAHPTGAHMNVLFDQFWDAWPLKKGKKEARTAFEKAIKSGVSIERILAGVENYRREIGPTPDWSKVKYPQGWLNAARWEDEPTPAPMNEPVVLRSPEAPEDCGRHKWAVDGTCLFCNTRRVVA